MTLPHIITKSRTLWAGLLLGLCLLLPAPAAHAQDQQPGAPIPGRLIVGVDPNTMQAMQPAAALEELGVQVVAATDPCAVGDQAVYQAWQVPVGQEEQVLEALRGQPGILFVEQDRYVQLAQEGEPAGEPAGEPTLSEAEREAELVAVAAAEQVAESIYTVNDPLYLPYQWAPQRANLPRAWQLVPNMSALTTIRVAVLDTGVDFGHPDLALRLLPGKNYLNPGTLPLDDNGHGTHVAGIIGAATNNGVGVAGSAPRVLIDPYRVLNADGGSILNIRYAICEATRAGARVINMSIQYPPELMPPGSPSYNMWKGAMEFAAARGVLLVAAAGNDPSEVRYPALFPEVMAVASLGIDNNRAPYSGIGPKVEIAAPGGAGPAPVMSTWHMSPTTCSGGRPLVQSSGAWYCGISGTSMASPYVAGVGALALSMRPEMSGSEVRSLLTGTATSVGLPSNQQGAGIVNAENVVRRLLPPNLFAMPGSAGKNVPLGSAPFTTTLVLSNQSLDPLTISGVISGSAPWLSVPSVAGNSFSGSVRYGQPLALTVVISPTHLGPGVYTAAIRLTATRSNGTSFTRSLPLFVSVGSSRPLFLPYLSYNTIPKPTDLGVSFTWEKSISPTLYSLGASGSLEVALPFSFPFPGQPGADLRSYGRARIYADGFITFPDGGPVVLDNPGKNRCLPVVAADAVQGVFGWWADLDTGVPGAQVSTFRPLQGASRFVIEYKDVAAVGADPSDRVSFQIVLYATGDVQLNYLKAPALFAPALTNLMPPATIGLQAQNGVYRNQIACRTATVRTGTLPQSGQSLRLKVGTMY